MRNFLPAACLCVHSSCYHPEAELAVPSLLPDENKDTCSSLLGALPFAVRCPFAASAADCRATCALFRALCEFVLLFCFESVLLFCSNSPSWPSRPRCLVSVVTHATTYLVHSSTASARQRSQRGQLGRVLQDSVRQRRAAAAECCPQQVQQPDGGLGGWLRAAPPGARVASPLCCSLV